MGFCLVALGSNSGDRITALSRAVAALNAPPFLLRAQSTWHETAPVGGPPGQPPYINGAAIIETSLPPERVLDQLLAIETSLGRTRDVRWGPRTVDLDFLLYDSLALDTPRLTLPHPRLAFRKFVIEPAAEIAATWRHPTIGWTLRQLREHLRHATPYVAIAGPAGAGKTSLATCLAARCDARFISDPARSVLDGAAAISAGPAWATEIELLARRRAALARASWESPERWSVSDFWLEQSRAYACDWPDAQRQRVVAAVEGSLPSTVPPKLLILLDPARAKESMAETEAAHARIVEQALIETASSAGVGPLLRLTTSDLQEQLAESAAAIQAMS